MKKDVVNKSEINILTNCFFLLLISKMKNTCQAPLFEQFVAPIQD